MANTVLKKAIDRSTAYDLMTCEIERVELLLDIVIERSKGTEGYKNELVLEYARERLLTVRTHAKALLDARRVNRGAQ